MPTLVSTGQITIVDQNDISRLDLSASSVVLAADASGVVSSFSMATTTVRVLLGATDDTASWTLSKVDTGCTSSLSGGVVTVTAMSADSAKVTITATRSGWPTLSDTFSLSKAKAGAVGADAIDVRLTNPAHAVPADSAGAVTSYTGAGTTIWVYEGGSALAYDGAGATAGTWTASASGSSITPGAINDGGSAAWTSNPSAMTADTASITFTVTGRTAAGTVFSRAAVQTITKAKAGANGADGSSGVNGTRTAVLDLYRWSATAPTTWPSGSSTYTWATGQFTAPATLNGWSLTPPAAVAGQTLYICRQLYADTGTSATSSVTWAATTARPLGAAGADGADGANGQRVGLLEVYRWSASAPTSYPSGTSTYTWATGAFTAPTTANGWSLTPGAAVAGQTLWGISVNVSDNLTTATSTATWNSSTVYAVGAAGTNGADGANATRTAILDLFQWASAPPTTFPAGTSTYTWATATYTLPATPNGWALQPGAGSSGQSLYLCRQVYADASTSSTSTVTWAATAAMAVSAPGAAGAPGQRTAVIELFKWSEAAPTTWPSGTSTYTWATGAYTLPATPNGWAILPGAPIPGATLWAVQAIASDSATTATTAATWSSTTALAISAAPRGGNLIDSSWWVPGATFRWTKADAMGGATTSIDWQAGPKGQVGPVVKATAQFTNMLVRAEANAPLTHWADSGDTAYTANGMTVDATKFVSGTASFKLTKASAGANSQGKVSRAFAVSPGQVYRVYLYAQGDSAGSSGFTVAINQAASAPAGGFVTLPLRASFTTVIASGAVSTSFAKYPASFTYTVPAGVYYVSLQIKPMAGAPANIWIADPVMSLTSATDVTPGQAEGQNGGWNADANNRITIDPTKTYRFIQPVYIASYVLGNIYWGIESNTVCTLATTTKSAFPQFAAAVGSTLTPGGWYLFTGTVFPAGSTYALSDDAGVWDATTGKKVANGTSYCWDAATTAAGVRAFQAYCLAGNTVYFGQPIAAVMDGQADPLKALLADAAILNAAQQWADVQAIPTASLGDCDSNSLGFNGAFLAWPTTQTNPTRWSTWNTAITTRSTAVQRDANGGPSARMICAGADGGLTRGVNLTTPLPAGSLLWGSVDIYLESRTAGVPMLLVRLFTNAGQTTYTDTYVVPTTTTGSWQRINWTARTPNLTDQIYGVQLFMIGSWTGTPGGAFTGTAYFANVFFEVVDKSIDNRSLQFSEVSGALTFNPSGNGTSSFTAVTANNRVTSGNSGSYIDDLALGTSKLGDESVSMVRGAVGTYSSTVVITLTAPADVIAIGTWTQGDFRENQTVGLYKDGVVYQAETPIVGTLGAMQYCWSAVSAGPHNFSIAAYSNTGDMRSGITVIVRYK